MANFWNLLKNLFLPPTRQSDSELIDDDYYDPIMDERYRNRVIADMDRAETMIKEDLKQHGSVQPATERFIRWTGHLDYENGSLVSFALGEPEDMERIVDEKALSEHMLELFTPVGEPLSILRTEKDPDAPRGWDHETKYTLEDGTVLLTLEKDRHCGTYQAHDIWAPDGYRIIRSYVPLFDDNRNLCGFQQLYLEHGHDIPMSDEQATAPRLSKEDVDALERKMSMELEEWARHWDDYCERDAALDDEMEPD